MAPPAILRTASVIGREFGFELLAKLNPDISTEEMIHALDTAENSSVITGDQGIAGRYQFAHALIQQTLNEELSTMRRLQIHAQIVEAIEGKDGDLGRDAEGAREGAFEDEGMGLSVEGEIYGESTSDRAAPEDDLLGTVAELERVLVKRFGITIAVFFLRGSLGKPVAAVVHGEDGPLVREKLVIEWIESPHVLVVAMKMEKEILFVPGAKITSRDLRAVFGRDHFQSGKGVVVAGATVREDQLLGEGAGADKEDAVKKGARAEEALPGEFADENFAPGDLHAEEER